VVSKTFVKLNLRLRVPTLAQLTTTDKDLLGKWRKAPVGLDLGGTVLESASTTPLASDYWLGINACNWGS